MNLIINIDGGSRGNPGPGASAYVIKNSSGVKIAQGGKFFASCTNNQAEFTALQLALRRAAELGGSTLIIRSDSQLLVKQYLGEYKIKNPQLKDLMAAIRQAAAKFAKINFTHVRREQNTEADALCNAIMDKELKGKPIAIAPKPAAPANPKLAGHEQLELF